MDHSPRPDSSSAPQATSDTPATTAPQTAPAAPLPWPQPSYGEFMQYPVVSATAALAVAVTLAWWAKIDVSVLFESPQVGRGQWWRLLTSALPHINIFHLVFNLSWLWVLGTKIERILGHLNTLLLFLILAIGSGAFEYAFLGPGVGLSGVGYGLFCFLWVFSGGGPRLGGGGGQWAGE